MRLLYVTSLSGKRINSFMKSAIVAAKELGMEFTLACNTSMAEPEYTDDCSSYGIKLVHIPFERNPLSLANIKAYNKLLQLMKKERYDMVHCNTPIGGVVGRLCAKKARIPFVIYQAHGFHFWQNAPRKNWMLYYPIEKYLAKYCDRLVTINREDYDLSLTFELKNGGQCVYIPGVGIDLEAIRKEYVDTKEECESDKNNYIYVTTGRLDRNKNIETIINAFSTIKSDDSKLLICGDGEERENLEKIVREKCLNKQIVFLGFRDDVIRVLKSSDCFVFASFREGLPASLMEAISVGLPCIASRIRGNTDLLPNSELLFDPNDVNELANKMILVRDKELAEREVQAASSNIKQFEFNTVVEHLKALYRSSGFAFDN